jgi:hypothetical protein
VRNLRHWLPGGGRAAVLDHPLQHAEADRQRSGGEWRHGSSGLVGDRGSQLTCVANL